MYIFYGLFLLIPYALALHTLPSQWYVIGSKREFNTNKPKKITLKEIPIAVWKDTKENFSAVFDVCPHRGASLARGRIDIHNNCIVCPYHTFSFNHFGRLSATPGCTKPRKEFTYNIKTDIPHFHIMEHNGWIYIKNEPIYDILTHNHDIPHDLWSEPEANDSNFRCQYLRKSFQTDARTVCENSLDILHISEVHSFGNKQNPLPEQDQIEEISPNHFRATYLYKAGKDSIARKLFKYDDLIVENEFVLPHTTVARVKFGPYTNTIVTAAQPINETSSILHIKVYRNNWVFPYFPPLNLVFDTITMNMMRKTVDEDKKVVDHIYNDYKDGNFITKYDELVKIYRQKLY